MSVPHIHQNGRFWKNRHFSESQTLPYAISISAKHKPYDIVQFCSEMSAALAVRSLDGTTKQSADPLSLRMLHTLGVFPYRGIKYYPYGFP